MFGLADALYSDPGTEFTAEVVQHLNAWLGIRHVISIVDRHESNGVEGTNKKVLRIIRGIVYDERVQSRWSEPHILPLVFYIINSMKNSETGFSAMELMFGSEDARYFNIGRELTLPSNCHAYIKQLDADLKMLDKLTIEVQARIQKKREGSVTLENRNVFKPGDYVTFQENTDHHLPTKLTPRFRGPYVVISHRSNDVQCRHLNLGIVETFHVTRLQRFYATEEEAMRIAKIDRDQHTIKEIRGYRGDPWKRTTMTFEVHFADGTVLWKPYDDDLYQTYQFEQFVLSNHALRPLRHSAVAAKAERTRLNKINIDHKHLGAPAKQDVEFWLDAKHFGFAWFDSIAHRLPDPDHTRYVFHCTYTLWQNARNHLKICVCVTLTNETLIFTHYDVRQWGMYFTLQPDMVVVDRDFVNKVCSQIVTEKSAAELLQ